MLAEAIAGLPMNSNGAVWQSSPALATSLIRPTGYTMARGEIDGVERDMFSRADRLFDAIEIYISTNFSGHRRPESEQCYHNGSSFHLSGTSPW